METLRGIVFSHLGIGTIIKLADGGGFALPNDECLDGIEIGSQVEVEYDVIRSDRAVCDLAVLSCRVISAKGKEE